MDSRYHTFPPATVRILHKELSQLTKEPVEGFIVEPDTKVDCLQGGDVTVEVNNLMASGYEQVASGHIRTAGDHLSGRILQG